MNPLRISVIGGGYWGKKVAREILDIGRTTGEVQLHSIVDSSPESLARCSGEFGAGPEYISDYQSLVSDPSISGVHISTPNSTHFEVASAFLRHGKHVLVEKPLTLKTYEANELVRLARENDRVLCVGHIHRFNNGVKELRRVMSEGLLGDPYYVFMRWTAFMSPQLQREVITDLAPHPFDICNYILDKWPEKVSCKGRGYRTRQNEEVAFITTEHSGGLLAHIELSWLDRVKRREVSVVASKGSARLDCADQKLFIQRSEAYEEIPVSPSNTLREEIIHYSQCIRNNGNSAPFHNHSDGVLGARVVTMLEACRESLFHDRAIHLQLSLAPEIPVK